MYYNFINSPVLFILQSSQVNRKNNNNNNFSSSSSNSSSSWPSIWSHLDSNNPHCCCSYLYFCCFIYSLRHCFSIELNKSTWMRVCLQTMCVCVCVFRSATYFVYISLFAFVFHLDTNQKKNTSVVVAFVCQTKIRFAEPWSISELHWECHSMQAIIWTITTIEC